MMVKAYEFILSARFYKHLIYIRGTFFYVCCSLNEMCPFLFICVSILFESGIFFLYFEKLICNNITDSNKYMIQFSSHQSDRLLLVKVVSLRIIKYNFQRKNSHALSVQDDADFKSIYQFKVQKMELLCQISLRYCLPLNIWLINSASDLLNKIKLHLANNSFQSYYVLI